MIIKSVADTANNLFNLIASLANNNQIMFFYAPYYLSYCLGEDITKLGWNEAFRRMQNYFYAYYYSDPKLVYNIRACNKSISVPVIKELITFVNVTFPILSNIESYLIGNNYELIQEDYWINHTSAIFVTQPPQVIKSTFRLRVPNYNKIPNILPQVPTGWSLASYVEYLTACLKLDYTCDITLPIKITRHVFHYPNKTTYESITKFFNFWIKIRHRPSNYISTYSRPIPHITFRISIITNKLDMSVLPYKRAENIVYDDVSVEGLPYIILPKKINCSWEVQPTNIGSNIYKLTCTEQNNDIITSCDDISNIKIDNINMYIPTTLTKTLTEIVIKIDQTVLNEIKNTIGEDNFNRLLFESPIVLNFNNLYNTTITYLGDYTYQIITESEGYPLIVIPFVNSRGNKKFINELLCTISSKGINWKSPPREIVNELYEKGCALLLSRYDILSERVALNVNLFTEQVSYTDTQIPILELFKST